MPAPTKDEFGQLTSAFEMLLDVCRRQWNALRRTDHFRREGVSNLSHDLRSPLTATVACLETLDGRWADAAERADDRRLVEIALRNTRNAARMVQSLGDLAKLDEPEFGLRSEAVDAGELLDDIVLRFAERAARQGVTLAATHEPDGGDTLPHARLFDRFYQSRQTVAPATGDGGRGLGLAIVKRIAELHGGDVSVESTLGQGTRVTTHWPAAS